MIRRLLLGYLGLTLFVLAVLEVPLGIQNQRTERRTLAQKVEHDAATLASISEEALQTGSARQLAAVASYAYDYANTTGGRVIVVDRRGAARVDTSLRRPGPESFASRPEIKSALQGQVATGTRPSQTLHTSLLFVAVPVAANGVVRGAVRVTFSTAEVDERVRRYWLVLGVVALAVLAAASLVGVSVARFVTGPLRGLERAAAAVGEGDLDARAPERQGPPEVKSLARVFNDTVAKLELLVRSQREFVEDASHELRTPLTALRLRLELGDVEGGLREAERLGDLVEGLLALARSDAGNEPAAAVDLGALVVDRVAHWRPLAEESGIDLRSDTAAATVHAAPTRLTQIVDNLVANALDAARSRVTVVVRPGELRVVDDGPGMTAEQLARAFDRFWTTRDDGSGLGLAIVKRLAEADGGTVELRDAPGGGLEAVVGLRGT